MRRLACLLALTSGLAVADVPPRSQSCQADSECVITRFDGCCPGCGCPAGPRAIAAAELKRHQARCARVDCALRKCAVQACPAPAPQASFRAVCRNGACEAVKVAATAAPGCRADADCTIAYPAQRCAPGPCGCCPGTIPQAVPLDTSEEEQPTQPGKPPDVQFGLSPAPRTGPDPPNCSPCRAPEPAQARCSTGRCVVAPRPRLP